MKVSITSSFCAHLYHNHTEEIIFLFEKDRGRSIILELAIYFFVWSLVQNSQLRTRSTGAALLQMLYMESDCSHFVTFFPTFSSRST